MVEPISTKSVWFRSANYELRMLGSLSTRYVISYDVVLCRLWKALSSIPVEVFIGLLRQHEWQASGPETKRTVSFTLSFSHNILYRLIYRYIFVLRKAKWLNNLSRSAFCLWRYLFLVDSAYPRSLSIHLFIQYHSNSNSLSSYCSLSSLLNLLNLFLSWAHLHTVWR